MPLKIIVICAISVVFPRMFNKIVYTNWIVLVSNVLMWPVVLKIRYLYQQPGFVGHVVAIAENLQRKVRILLLLSLFTLYYLFLQGIFRTQKIKLFCVKMVKDFVHFMDIAWMKSSFVPFFDEIIVLFKEKDRIHWIWQLPLLQPRTSLFWLLQGDSIYQFVPLERRT